MKSLNGFFTLVKLIDARILKITKTTDKFYNFWKF
jgi:hypothetical protein